MKQKMIEAHMKCAYIYSELSYCTRKKVGCVVVKNNKIISIGYNGTPSGEPNICEDKDGVTTPNVIHAEMNALLKITHSTESAEGAALFTTLAPCYACAIHIFQSGIKSVYYNEEFRSDRGIQFLIKKGVNAVKSDISWN